MKGNGRIIAFFAILVLIVIVIVLNMTLFTVSEIAVYNKVVSELIVADDIIEASEIAVGSNIFALSERKAIKNIELANPYIRVTSIERRFPNKIYIHVTVRTPVMTVAVSESEEYALLDCNLKILGFVDGYSNLYSASTKITGISVENPVLGESLTDTNPYNSALYAIGNTAFNENLDGVAFLTFFESIAFSDAAKNNVRITVNSGVTFALTNVGSIEEQLRYCLEKYKLTDELSEERKSGYFYFDSTLGWSWTGDVADLD
jgi:hypothetical protein